MRVLAVRATSRRRRARSLTDVQAHFVFDSPNSKTSSSSSCGRSGSFFVDTEGESPAAASSSSAGGRDVKRRRMEADENATAQELDGPLAVDDSRRSAVGTSQEIAPVINEEVVSEEPELSSLSRFYLESGSSMQENRRRNAKTTFVMSRFFFQDSVETKVTSHEDVPNAAKEALEASKALRTDDGYLTKMGTKHFCVVCCGSGHKAASCGETRCWICFDTGHNVKACPKAAEKCKRCGRKGHSAEVCMYQQLSEAGKYWALESVRCVRCGQTGHTICHADGVAVPGADELGDPDTRGTDDDEKAWKVAAALTGRWRAGASWDREGKNTAWQSGRGWSKSHDSDGDWKWWEEKHVDSYNNSKDQHSKWHRDWNQRKDRSRHAEKVSNSKRSAADPEEMLAQLQSKLQKQHGRAGGSSWPQSRQTRNRSDRSSHHHGKIPSSRIRDQPSARQARRAKQKRK